MTEPTRILPRPSVNSEGDWSTSSALSGASMTVRGEAHLPPDRIIPVIVVPGIMGSNLRATTDPGKEQNHALRPGEPAWRPPNGAKEGIVEVGKWKNREPKVRQQILDPNTVEVDGTGEIHLSMFADLDGVHEAQARERGWGEIHWDSYGLLLFSLERNLNKTFQGRQARVLRPHWLSINAWDRKEWGTRPDGVAAPLTIAEFHKYARYHYPVYACGYNWLGSNEESAKRLQQRIEAVIAHFANCKMECEQVILVTHSMGGLVARACAKNIPDKIAGIVHGVMPALGAPLCYRRIACGTESSSPGGSWIGNLEMSAFATIAGRTAAETTPVMATSPGPLELLPNHLYPKPWLFVTAKQQHGSDIDWLRLPRQEQNPYDLYRDTKPWYRLIDPALADPASMHKDRLGKDIKDAVDQAEHFHTEILDTYYHQHSYAFYGDDFSHPSFGLCRWTALDVPSGLSESDIRDAKPQASPLDSNECATFDKRNIALTLPRDMADTVLHACTGPDDATRNVSFGTKGKASFQHSMQDTSGDGTVPSQSGRGPEGKVKHLFATRGYDHQGSYSNEAMLALTQHLIVKIVQSVA